MNARFIQVPRCGRLTNIIMSLGLRVTEEVNERDRERASLVKKILQVVWLADLLCERQDCTEESTEPEFTSTTECNQYESIQANGETPCLVGSIDREYW